MREKILKSKLVKILMFSEGLFKDVLPFHKNQFLPVIRLMPHGL
jgi:hypothetical protein